MFSSQEELQAGQQAQASVRKQLPLLPDSDPIVKYVQRLGAQLAAHAPGEKWPYSFHVVNQKEINAFALPGGPVYVNLGTNQGLKVGDYLRIFRYQGSMAETVPQEKGYAYTMYGFGSAPARYEWNDLPREVVGEGIVINVSRNSSTMIVTLSSIETFAGDYVEIE